MKTPTKNFFKKIHITSYFLFSYILSFSQKDPLVFFEQIKDDSVVMFINENYRFTEKNCAIFFRYIKIDSAGNFNGYFEDKNIEQKIIAKGCYINGSKDGDFEIYYLNGNIQCSGKYRNDRPIGKWYFFNENGSKDRTLLVSETDTFLIDLYDQNQNKIVDSGFGEFHGYVAGLYKVTDYPHPITATGKIENGKPEGKWTATFLDSAPYCKEEFEQGRIITGSFPESVMGRIVNYSDRSYLNTFFLNNYLKKLEFFLTGICPKNTEYKEFKVPATPTFSFDIQRFNSDLRSQLNRQIENDLKNTLYKWEYKEGDNELVLQFKVNEKGRAYDFILLSGWGQRLTDIIEYAIRKQEFPSSGQTLKFRLNLHFPGGQSYQYSFRFSQE